MDEEAWTDWEEELDEVSRPNEEAGLSETLVYPTNLEFDSSLTIDFSKHPRADNINSYRKKSINKIDDLDIDCEKEGDDMDFFKDMEPVIQTSNVLSIDLSRENDQKLIEI